MRPGFVILSAITIILLAADPSFAVGPVGVRLQPHVAVYDLSLRRSQQRMGLVGVNGRLAIEISGSECEDWTVSFRMVSQFISDDQSVRVLDTQSSTWEAGDGKSLNVSQRHFVDSALDTESKVTASTDAGGRTHGVVKNQQVQEFELAPGTIFPVMHLQRLIETAERGELRDKSSVFDGTEGSKSYVAITLIGGERKENGPADALKAEGSESLSGVKAWPAMISYYDQTIGENNDGLPTYEVSVEMFDNGVSGNMVIDYGDYALEARLAKLQLKPYGKCN
jgi:hypothetical protein